MKTLCAAIDSVHSVLRLLKLMNISFVYVQCAGPAGIGGSKSCPEPIHANMILSDGMYYFTAFCF